MTYDMTQEQRRAMLEALGRPFPPNAIERRAGAGGRLYDYVAAETVIRRLNSATSGEWSFVITGHEWRGELLITWGELTIPGLGTRSGTGVQKVTANAGEDIIKGSASDCLKKCATQFGVALELYGPDLEAGEAHQPTMPPQHARRPPEAPKRDHAAPDMGDTATAAQLAMIHHKARAAGMSAEQLDQHIRDTIHPQATLKTLKKRDASRLIDDLGERTVHAQQMAGLQPTDTELAASNPDRFTR